MSTSPVHIETARRFSKTRLEFCRDHKISPAFFHKLVNEGRLKAVKLAGKTVVRDVDEAAFLDALEPARALAA